MLYYRTHASRVGEMPPELSAWRSTGPNANLNEQTIGEHRVLAITPPFVFAAPDKGWTPIGRGWEAANVGEFNPLDHAKLASTWMCSPADIGGLKWMLPVVLTDTGARAFKVRYGGQSFLPTLTDEQTWAFELAKEVRICHEANTWPSDDVRARWCARLLQLTYCLSVETLAIVGIDEDVVAATLATAGGYARGDG